MAGQEFTCAHCGIVALQQAGCGRPKRFCSNRCRWNESSPRKWQKEKASRAPKPLEFTACQHCGTQVPKGKAGPPTRYCGRTCKERAERAAYPPPPIQPRTCDHCGDPYTPLKPTQAGQTVFYCCGLCKLRAYKQRHGILPHIPLPPRHRVAVARGREAAAARREAPCVVCGKPVGFRRSAYCADAICRASALAHRSACRRGANLEQAERFSPWEVFERDGWRCQICGVSTPESRRGTRHRNAPELDHRIPISRGGRHTRANAQCSCRACNLSKGNRLVIGQLGLFTSIL